MTHQIDIENNQWLKFLNGEKDIGIKPIKKQRVKSKYKTVISERQVRAIKENMNGSI